MKCPSCGVVGAEGAAECAACGLLFSKWRERQERQEREAAAALAQLEVKPRSAWNPWIGRSIAIGATIIWCALFTWYVHRETLRARERALESKENEGTVQFRDPNTGDLKTLRLPQTPARPPSSDKPDAGPGAE